MSKIAIISDIHGNADALKTVLEDIRSEKIETVYCLGDIVGYGAKPAESLDLVMQTCVFSVRGNHDHAVLTETPNNYRGTAIASLDWTRDILKPNDHSTGSVKAKWDYLRQTPTRKIVDGVLYVHGTPELGKEWEEYLEGRYLDMGFIINGWEGAFSQLSQDNVNLCFIGHTHEPGIAYVEDKVYSHFLTPNHLPNGAHIKDGRIHIVNVGSVGQPRDEDPRACYAIFNKEAMIITYRRVEYNIEAAQKAIRSVQELHPDLAERLEVGH